MQSSLGSGPLISSFDPILTGTFQLDQNRVQSVSPFNPPFSDSHTATWDFGYQQGFHWGTNLSVGFNNTRGTASPLSPFQAFQTQFNTNFRAQATQHLLQGFGLAANTRFIQIAKNNRELSDVAFRLQITTTVDQIENMYWDLVFAYENAQSATRGKLLSLRRLCRIRKSRCRLERWHRLKWSGRRVRLHPTSKL